MANRFKKAQAVAEIAVLLFPAIVADYKEIDEDLDEARAPESDGGREVTLDEIRDIVAENLRDSDTIDAIAVVVQKYLV